MLVRVQKAPVVPQDYLRRQRTVAALATGIDGVPVHVEYLAEEHETWAAAQARLVPAWEQHAALPVRAAANALDLPRDQIPQLSMVSDRLQRMTRFRFASVSGTVSGAEFFGALAHRVFPSTQFIRWSGSSEYTPEPDVLHEIGGHANVLAHPKLAALHVLAGQASLAAPHLLTEIAAVFWYSVEFGVVASPSGWKAYGAGLLSSPGELASFANNAEILPLDIDAMLTTPYDISRFQPVLFGAESLDQVVEIVGGYFSAISAH